MQLSASDDKDTYFPCHARPKKPCQQYHNKENYCAQETFQDYSSREPPCSHHYSKESSIYEDISSFIQLLNSGDDKVRLEAASALCNIVSTNHASTVVDYGALPYLVNLIENGRPDVSEECAKCIGTIAGSSSDLRDIILQSEVLDHLLKVLDGSMVQVTVKTAVWTISQLCSTNPQPKFDLIAPVISQVAAILEDTNQDEVLAEICWLISSLSNGCDSCVQALLNAGVKPKLMALVTHKKESVVAPALRALRRLVPKECSLLSCKTKTDRTIRDSECIEIKSTVSLPMTMIPSTRRPPENLSELDIVTCQNVEVFQATQEDVVDCLSRNSSEGIISTGQIGIRCLHCGSTPFAKADFSTVFPGSIGSIAASLRKMAEIHFSHCALTPSTVKEKIDQARRSCEHWSFRGAEIGKMPESDDSFRMNLITFCVELCNDAGLINRRPTRSGIVLESKLSNDKYANSNRLSSMSSFQEKDVMHASPVTTKASSSHNNLVNREEGKIGFAEQQWSNQVSHPRKREDYMSGAQNSQRLEDFHSSSQGRHVPANHIQISHELFGQRNFHSSGHFFEQGYNLWECRHCCSIPYSYRNPGSVWHGIHPPDSDFIDRHLSQCWEAYKNFHTALHHRADPEGGHEWNDQYSTQNSNHASSTQPWAWATPSQEGRIYHSAQRRYSSLPPRQQIHLHPDQMCAQSVNYFQQQSSCTAIEAQGRGFSHQTDQLSVSNDNESGVAPTIEHGFDGDQYEYSKKELARAPPRQSHSVVEKDCNRSFLKSEILQNQNKGSYWNDDSESALVSAINCLSNSSQKSEEISIEGEIVLVEDKVLITDFFFYLLKQLRKCHFTESDIKTRGGKRINAVIGFPGFQCVHCAETSKPRKYFWSDSKRLVNSFSEISNHLLKCKHCPEEKRRALQILKKHHQRQMGKLPRGSQKVFFRKMWRRLHTKYEATGTNVMSPESDENNTSAEARPRSNIEIERNDQTKRNTSVGDTSDLIPVMSTDRAAQTLAESTDHPVSSTPSHVLLAMEEDKEWLLEIDCFVRQNLEVFCATANDVEIAREFIKTPLTVGQVGIRCVHCALSIADTGPTSQDAVHFPKSIEHIYEHVRDFQRTHLQTCSNLPQDFKTKVTEVRKNTSLSSALRNYYVLAAKRLGMRNTTRGICIDSSFSSQRDDTKSISSCGEEPQSPTNYRTLCEVASPITKATIRTELAATPVTPVKGRKRNCYVGSPVSEDDTYTNCYKRACV